MWGSLPPVLCERRVSVCLIASCLIILLMESDFLPSDPASLAGQMVANPDFNTFNRCSAWHGTMYWSGASLALSRAERAWA